MHAVKWIYISKAVIQKDCEKELTSIQKLRDVFNWGEEEEEEEEHVCVIAILTVGLAKSAELNTEHHQVQREDRQHANTSLEPLIEQTQLTYRDSA